MKRLEMVDISQRDSLLLPCCPVNHECSWKKIQMEKKLFGMYYFSQIPLMTSLDSLSDLLKGTTLSSAFCILLNVQLFSRNSCWWLLPWVMVILDKAHLNSLKFLLWWTITKKNVCKEAFFKKSFLFILIFS